MLIFCHSDITKHLIKFVPLCAKKDLEHERY